MNNFRKYAAYLLVAVFVIFIASTGLKSCKTENDKPKLPTMPKAENYEPKFVKNATGALVSAATGDTLKNLEIEFANTADKIEYGMMYRKSMADNMGMLFFMGNMEMRSFWMKNTYVSLDIIFLDDQLKIVSIQRNAAPLTTESRPSTGPAQYVLEIKGGQSDLLGLQSGDILRYSEI